jgi:hypothetical protein
MSKTPDVKGAKADRSFFSFHPNNAGTPVDRPERQDSPGQAAWSSLKQRQKGDPIQPQRTYTSDEVEEIVKHAVAEALKMAGKTEKAKEKKEPEEIKIGGK